MNTNNIKMIYTIFIFTALAAFDNIIIGLFPPLFSSIAKDMNVPISSLGIISAVNILVTSFSSILWGYLAGKFNRKLLIIIGTIIWSLFVLLTSHCSSYAQFFIFQVFTGIGLGCIASIGFSILTDYIPNKYRGMMLSLWGMAQGFGGISGSLMASLMASFTSWREPFEIVGIIGFFLIILYFFIKEPVMGESEPEVQKLISEGHEYNYNIEFNHLPNIILKKSDMLLFLQAFFMNITIGTLIWMPTLYISKIEQYGYSPKVSIIAAGYLFALFQIGGLISPLFGHIGDILQKKTYKGRAILTSYIIFAMIPFYIAVFVLPVKSLVLPQNNDPLLILIYLLKEVIVNPWIFMLFIFSFFASALQSANTPNWLALITDVNLPEHRGTAFSIANLANGLGRTIGNAGVGILISTIFVHIREPKNYIITLCLFQVSLIPSALIYMKMAKNNVKDIKEVKETLFKRAKGSAM
ncbi:MFS transporter [Clostridium luticellarii]|jgi:MFS family permease|uniref:Putative sulfoacetate transporter SauU n=1 Tax=Clostridium luticellarii TaxID=1691940 RepID=A0A2T0BPL0_9CLOT|nr:MFS transporter [Clostridium luticellarii]MCI1944208.1 MFS transporter [Clostridium luticellarii]MCI1967710.1 MFS transporter [Clostridium luticellarii]MCI1994841.1 MFS transporter [Clostridium luticellarii]MCI2039674.1 MFS transporter [Clostridium luticellarii]PRR85821.1 putative sulfoacetate transporter SauU [Clostridium luticellarii]